MEGAILAAKYRLETLLGRGGMGSVWRATHLGLHAPVAIKLIEPQYVSSGEAIARFHREARAAAGIRSPHVVQILDHGVDEATHTPFIAMELMEGESLARRLQQVGKLAPADAGRVVTHVARALSRAHDAGIVHRDLKPDNVFLVQNEDEEIAKVLDFGIAKAQGAPGIDSATRTGAVMGTPYYMSPEQISGAKGVDFRTDLWALGVIAFECLLGVRPFDGETIGGLTLKICVEPLPRPSSLGAVPAGFDRWFEKAVARDMNARFSSAREMAEELRRVVSGDSTIGASSAGPVALASSGVAAVSLPSTGPLSRTTPEDRIPGVPRKRSLALPLTLVGVVLAAGVGGVAFLTSRTQPAAEATGEPTATAPAISQPTAVPAAPTTSEPVVVAPSAPSASAEPQLPKPSVAPARPVTKKPIAAAPVPAPPRTAAAPAPVAAPAAPATGAASKTTPNKRTVLDQRR